MKTHDRVFSTMSQSRSTNIEAQSLNGNTHPCVFFGIPIRSGPQSSKGPDPGRPSAVRAKSESVQIWRSKQALSLSAALWTLIPRTDLIPY